MTTLDPARPAGRLPPDSPDAAGAVIAMVPSTGAIKVFADSPSYDPNKVKTQAGLQALLAQTKTTPLLNRVTQAQYAPGSTFKVVTAIAAIDSGRYTPESVLSGKSPIVVSGAPLSNDSGTSYGPVTLTDALTNSINTAWANVAKALGAPTLQTYMNRLGFYSTPPIDLPRQELSPRAASATNRAASAACRSPPAPTSAASESARAGSTLRRYRWRWSHPRSPITAC